MGLRTSDFHYDLPPELIASRPLEERAASRMMVVHRDSGKIEHRTPAEEDLVLLQLFQVLINLRFGQPADLRHLAGRKAAAVDQELENRVHSRRRYPSMHPA